MDEGQEWSDLIILNQPIDCSFDSSVFKSDNPSC